MTDSPPTKTRRFSVAWILTGLCAVLVGLGGVIAVDSLRTTNLQRAEEALSRRDRAAAITAYRAHLADHPQAMAARYKLALLLRDIDMAAALVELQKIPPDASEHVDAMRQIAVIYLILKRDDDAERALHAVEQLAPDDFGIQLSLAELYFRRRKIEQSLPHALKAAKIRPRRVDTYLLIADIRDELNQTAEMIPPLRKAIEIEPDHYVAHLNLAYACYATGQLKDAAREARWCLARKPREAFAHRTLAAVARDEGRFDEARRELQIALKLAPADLDTRLLEADLLMYDHHPKKAYQRLKPLYKKHKETERYLGSLIRAAAASGHRDEARRLHKELGELHEKQKRELAKRRPK